MKTWEARFKEIQEAKAAVKRKELELIVEARNAGFSWDSIGEFCGLSRQGVNKKYAPFIEETVTSRLKTGDIK